ncbi:MAG: GxxExxY protein [Gemmatimonadetes bacterium]|nr:GxxExxY protein [Gemmatimonadota bacterium]
MTSLGHPSALVHAVIGAFFDVYNELGYGLHERVYCAALEILLLERGYSVRREVPIAIFFHGKRIGRLRSDMIVNDTLMIESKAGPLLRTGSKAQLINYQKRAGLEFGLLLFFGPVPEFTKIHLPCGTRDVH